MKYLLIVLIIASLFTGAQAQSNPQDPQAPPPIPQAQQGWAQVSTPATSTISGVVGTGSDSVWASSDANGILRSTNRGLTWTVVPTPVLHGAMLFQDGNVGFIGGPYIHRTMNGGLSWDSTSSNLNDIDALVAASRDTLFGIFIHNVTRSIDGGRSWAPKVLNAASVEAISFSDHLHGFIVGTRQNVILDSPRVGSVFRTIDGGEHWVLHYSGLQYDLYSVAALTDSIVVAGSPQGYIARSTDGGNTWKDTLVTQLNWGIQALSFRNKSEGIAVGGLGNIVFTSDAGISWHHQTSPTSKDLQSVTFIDDTTALISGDNGTMLRTTNTGLSWIPQTPRAPSSMISIYPNPSTATTRFEFTLPIPQRVSLAVYSLNGQLIQQILVDQLLGSGDHQIIFDGSAVPSGTYEYQLKTGANQSSGRFQLIR